MYITTRASVVRNFSLAAVNGCITLVILLIAPLGLAAVIANTFLVTAATFFTATAADRIILYLQPDRARSTQNPLDYTAQSPQIIPGDSQNSERK